MCLAEIIGKSIDCASTKAAAVVRIKKTMLLYLSTIFRLDPDPRAYYNLKLKNNTLLHQMRTINW